MKKPLNSTKRRIYQLSAIFYFQQYTGTQSRIHKEITVLFICSFIFSWIWNNNSRSGSKQKFRIHADPDPQLWIKQKNLPTKLKTLNFHGMTSGNHLRLSVVCRLLSHISCMKSHVSHLSQVLQDNIQSVLRSRSFFDRLRLQVLFFTAPAPFHIKIG